MVELYCPKGMKLISGEVKGYPELSAVDPFCIDETEVTQDKLDAYDTPKEGAKYELVASRGMGHSVIARGSDKAELRRLAGQVISSTPDVTAVEVKSIRLETLDRPAPEPKLAGPNKPAVYVNYLEASMYCQNRGGGLPTGSEWEKAARGPQGYDYGTKSGTLNHGEANYRNDEDEVHATVDVKTFESNGYGVYDLTGNVAEWTGEHRPIDMREFFVRGGNWLGMSNYPELLQVGEKRSYHEPQERSALVGFRCVSNPKSSNQ